MPAPCATIAKRRSIASIGLGAILDFGTSRDFLIIRLISQIYYLIYRLIESYSPHNVSYERMLNDVI